VWDRLKEKIESLPAFRSLEGRLGEEGGAAPATGLVGSSRSLVLSILAGKFADPALVLAADPVSARDIAADLEEFGLTGVVSYPEDEILPYDYHDPDRNLTGQQMLALERLTEGECRVLVSTPRAILKKVFPPSLFRALLFDLAVGGREDPQAAAEKLVRLGYERHGTVESKGQFAIRGAILDIFEVASEDPVRIEFDSDEIATIRRFDIETQRSIGNLQRIRIRPLHHLAPDPAGMKRLRAFLAEGAVDGEELKRRMLAADRMEEGILFYGMEHYASVVHDVVPVFEYFDRPPVVVTFDTEDVDTVTEEFREETARRHGQSLEKEHRYPEPDAVYVTGPEMERFLEGKKRIDFRRLPAENAVVFSTSSPGDYRRNLKGLAADIAKDVAGKQQVLIFCSSDAQRERAEEILSDVALDVDFPSGFISNGFRWPGAGVVFLSEEEIFGRYHRSLQSPRARNRSLTYDPSHFQPGDFVVHVNHGIGRYMGMRVLDIEGGRTECLDIRYEGANRLFIPVTQLRMVEKYVAADGVAPQLADLGSRAWNRIREGARKSASRIAGELLEIYAARQLVRGYAFGPDKPWQSEMEASFPWEETPHQLKASAEVKADLESARPMDRLLCGDVGFGKTEVALRAAFKVVLEGKQVAILVPTTVLAMQHLATLTDRLAGFPVRTEMLSRFVSPARQKKIAAEAAEGKVDILVGTHRLLSKDVAFKDLGLVVIDEEHRFGVRHKEIFKMMKKSVDVLSMTATPIPRTLSMAISGIRDISVIDTAPRNRLPIHTEILPFDDGAIRDAIMREIDRGGQVFFVHNRVQSIEVMEGYLHRLLPPRVRIAHAHGQMNERDLERIMIDFLERRFDLLLCTMIIEAGLDFPNVNTIIINRSDRFGLAQLYQLRGRVGRSDRKAYAYMLVPRDRALAPTAVKRLQAISEFDYLGAGYRIAMRDLEIRGAGNLLGHQQSGQINAVGLDMYSRMIREEVARLKGEAPEEEREAKISIPVPAYLPEGYITDSEERMDIYRRLTRVANAAEVSSMMDELVDRFGPPPVPAGNLLMMVELKARAARAGLETVEITKRAMRAGFAAGSSPGRKLLSDLAAAFEGRLTFHTENGFSMTVRTGEAPSNEAGKAGFDSCKTLPGTADLESLLKLLEFYVN
jgi:transcription-repair coupling factor (superfamily II helicase)